MRKSNMLAAIVFPSLCFITACTSVPRDAPQELSQAESEIRKGKNLHSADHMPKSMTRAETALKGAVDAFKKSKAGLKKEENLERSIVLANRAKDLATGANSISKNLRIWDESIETLEGNYSISELIEERNQLRSTAAKVERERMEAETESRPIPEIPKVESPFAKMTEFRLDIPAVYFDSESSEVPNRYRRTLEELSKTVKAVDAFRVTVFGYSDVRGPREYNERLSRERAQNVASLLIEHGLQPSKVTVRGLGQRDAIDTDVSAQLQLERRAIVTVTVEKPQ
jgi:outer membrane protein OmpA-like peptidoglycan-associated protein